VPTPSLTQYAEANPLGKTGPKCCVCCLPPEILVQVNGARKKGIFGTQCQRWLRSLGYNISRHGVENHWRMGHHEKP
jgi:hypothetical protein